MPYSRRNTRYYRRGRRYRRGRALRTTNVLTRTSARSQARQIFTLNKKVNRLNYLARPEIKTVTKNLAPSVFDTGNPESLQPLEASLFLYDIGEHNEVANLYKIRSFNLNINITYGDNYLQNSGKDASRSFGLRFILVQALTPSTVKPLITDIMPWSIERPEQNGILPLREGVTSTARIVGDWRYIVTDQRPMIVRRLFFNHMNDLVYNRANQAETYPAGNIYLYVIPFGYHLIEGFEQQVHLSMDYKYAYTQD